MPSIFDLINSNRSIFLFQDIHSHTAEFLIRDLLRMNQEDSKEDINLFLNSDGGVIIDTFGIIDVMKAISAPINTIVLGMAGSAASLISAHGNKRFISPNSEMMIHEAATFVIGSTRDRDVSDTLDRTDKINQKINALYAQVTGKSIEEIAKILGSKDDTFLSAKESIKFGLADEILTSEQLNKIKLSEQFKPIKLSEPFSLDKEEKGDLKTVHLLKAVHIDKYGVEITNDTLKSLKANFDNNVRGQEISIDYTHKNDDGENPAAAWIKELSLSDDNLNLFAKVEYTPTAEKMIKDKEYKYLSVDIDQVWWNEEGKMFNNVLCGATFTNRPIVKGLNSMKLSENINNNKKIDMELNKAEVVSIEGLKKEGIKIEAFHTSYIEMKKQKDAFETENKKLVAGKEELETVAKTAKDTLIKMEKEQADSEKSVVVDSLVSKGIILNSHKDKVLQQFSSKSDIEEFYKGTPAIVSVKPQGNDMEDPDPDSDMKMKAKDLAKQTKQDEADILDTLKEREEAQNLK